MSPVKMLRNTLNYWTVPSRRHLIEGSPFSHSNMGCTVSELEILFAALLGWIHFPSHFIFSSFSFYSLSKRSPFFSGSFERVHGRKNILPSAYPNMSLFYTHLWMIIWDRKLLSFIILKVLLHRLLTYVISWDINAILSPNLYMWPKFWYWKFFNVFPIPGTLLWIFFHLICHAFMAPFRLETRILPSYEIFSYWVFDYFSSTILSDLSGINLGWK